MNHRPALVFTHANSFPAHTYRSLFRVWEAAGFDVFAPPMLGHDDRYPITNNWAHLTHELIDFIHQNVKRPAYLVGHSLGGLLSLNAALKEPALSLGIVMIDSPVAGGWKAKLLKTSKVLGFIHRFSPAKVAVRRRTDWSSHQEAHDHFKKKPVFAAWRPDVLQDYIDGGFVNGQSGITLKFKRENEAAIYNSLPHHLERALQKKPLQCPAAFIAATESEELKYIGLKTVLRIVGSRLTWIEGSHLVPFEKPVETADAVTHWIEKFQQENLVSRSAP